MFKTKFPDFRRLFENPAKIAGLNEMSSEGLLMEILGLSISDGQLKLSKKCIYSVLFTLRMLVAICA